MRSTVLRPTSVSPALHFAYVIVACLGCRSTVPIHVWKPAEVPTLSSARVALAPVAGDPELAHLIEQQLLAQRPAAKANVSLFTADQLADRSPVRLASTAALTSDLVSIQAARSVGADIVLQGEILSANLEAEALAQPPVESKNMNEAFFQRRQKKKPKEESLMLSWRVIDVATSRTLGAKSFTLYTKQASKEYPDLAMVNQDDTTLLVAASARETWKAISPIVSRERIRLAKPWLQPGAWRVRRGIAAAKRGQWQTAEEHWQAAVQWFPFCAPAHHNLAIAYAAQEDFAAAKKQLGRATGLFAIRLPGETLFWLDKHHRQYHAAHGLPKPENGWAFPDPPTATNIHLEPPVDLDELPWWTAIPLAKPPHWTWRNWLTQPIVL